MTHHTHEVSNGGDDARRLLSQLPAVELVLREPALEGMAGRLRREVLLWAVREVIETRRAAINGGKSAIGLSAAEAAQLAADLGAGLLEGGMRRVINASGVVLHTGLGRAVLPDRARQRVADILAGATDLEFTLPDGKRGRRENRVARMLRALTGAEAALVCNNNAAAVHLMLKALCQRREVIVSRGQQVEIGGGFRIPEVIRQSGARLVEVGCTNRTHLEDYAQAIGSRTAALLRVHPSNYKITGFTTEPALTELAALAHERNLLFLEDLGSGALVHFPGVPDPEPLVSNSLVAGADLVTFSGDKMLGGPQAGIIVGRAELAARLSRHPMMRALRCDKMTLAALEAVLEIYLERGAEAPGELPVWRACNEGREAARSRTRTLLDKILLLLDQVPPEGRDWGRCCDVPGTVRLRETDSEGRTGSGALPEQDLPSAALALKPLRGTVEGLHRRLRTGRPAVVGQVREDELLLDLKAVSAAEIDELAVAVTAALK